ncbi:MAG: alkaline phosphatase family protein [Candidatus Marinimicrobia bacterium]|nr:alkaline phosphatase family protein [Candidatus Neomarinimicrobiota bacterium]
MKHLRRFILLIATLSLLFGKSDQYVLLISFDGFRADYLDWYDTPNFDRLAEHGVKAKGMQPVFVSKTFPNHYSIATGMYADHHGLIANTFYDAKFDATYKISDRTAVEDARWYGGEPIWCTAEKQGVKTASCFWVGSESKAGGCQPSVWKRYDHDFPFEARVDSVMAWFNKPEESRPNLVLLYFHEPDNTGHRYGPNSKETEEMVEKMDKLLGEILDKSKSLEIYSRLNIIALSDHGMAEISPERTIRLSDHINMEGVIQEGSGPIAFLYGVDSTRLGKLACDLKNVPRLKVHLKANIPNRLHYKHNDRIKDLLLIADEGWSIIDEERDNPKFLMGGDHGYDNSLWSMHAIFVADGPAFKNGYQIGTFKNINVYPLISEILGITPNSEIDGEIEDIRNILNED